MACLEWPAGPFPPPEVSAMSPTVTLAPASGEAVTLDVAGLEVRVSSPDKVVFPGLGLTKRELAAYYQSVGDAALRAVRGRPMALKRYVDGAEKPPFFQKRAPGSRPGYVQVHTVRFPAGQTAEEVVCDNLATLLWAVNLGCIDLNPWAVRVPDVDHPDQLRIDLDPSPDSTWDDVRQITLIVRDVLRDFGLDGVAKTSGSRGMHVYASIQPLWSFDQTRRAAIALAREVERRAPGRATLNWWKEERPAGSIFMDYNQNARDRTIASAYSVRPTPDARVSTPLTWAEVPTVDPAAFTVRTVPARLAALGDPAAALDELPAGSLQPLLDQVARDEANGLGDATWPPHFAKAPGEPRRVQPSKRRKE